MAQRFGGRYSPGSSGESGTQGGPAGWQGRRPAYVGARANALFLLPLPFAVTAFLGSPSDMALRLGALALLLAAAWLTREGLRAQEAYDARKVARRPAIPRKIFGAVAMGAGLALGGAAPGGSLLDPALFAVLGAGLHLAAFGPDPLKDKGLAGMDGFQTDRVARAVAEAETHLAAMTEAIRKLADRRLADRMATFQANARKMFRAVEDDPRDLTAARRYLGVYLVGARDATEKFADLYARNRDPAARAEYESLLTDLEANFAAHTRQLLENDRTALDIEIEVLRDRLAREGLRPED
jgi:hypothetical protein